MSRGRVGGYKWFVKNMMWKVYRSGAGRVNIVDVLSRLCDIVELYGRIIEYQSHLARANS